MSTKGIAFHRHSWTPDRKRRYSERMKQTIASRLASGHHWGGWGATDLSKHSQAAMEDFEQRRRMRINAPRDLECALCGYDAPPDQDPAELCPKCNRLGWELHAPVPMEVPAA